MRHCLQGCLQDSSLAHIMYQKAYVKGLKMEFCRAERQNAVTSDRWKFYMFQAHKAVKQVLQTCSRCTEFSAITHLLEVKHTLQRCPVKGYTRGTPRTTPFCCCLNIQDAP